MPLVLTIDVEDWAQSTIDIALPIHERSLRNTEYLLDMLAETNRKVTCFVLGKYADKYPDSVKRIAKEGHEVASHGVGHEIISNQTFDEFREDVRRSKRDLEDLTGVSVTGYRAPRFSINADTLWALDVLAEEGYEYDSSINPSIAGYYKMPDWPRQPVRVELSDGKNIIELPGATMPLFGKRMPVAGGGYHRLLPWFVIKRIISSSLSRGETFVAYCHPYEFDPYEFEHLDYELSGKVKMHQGLGRGGFEGKFRKMLGCFDSVLANSIVVEDGLVLEKFRQTTKVWET